MDLAQLQKSLAGQRAIPPVESWDPDFCGNIDMQIKQDGSWWYMGTPITRQALVKLFSSVLKKQSEHYYLVTPVEKVGIQVEDVPFIITQWQHHGEHLLFITNQEDKFIVDEAHPVQLRQSRLSDTPLPYVRVRRNLWARLHQNVFYQLAELGQQQHIDAQAHLMLNSGNYPFSLGRLD